ncbi:MAG: alpha/beta hydrolase family protein [Gammaproteobacteria bacterium]
MWSPRYSLIIGSLALLGLSACSGPKTPSRTIVDTDRSRSIDYELWLPTSAGPAPLILVSHGTGGYYDDHQWLVDVLVQNGFAVAVLNHPGDHRMDRTPEGLLRAWDRPGDVSFLLTELLDDPQSASAIDVDRIAAVGYSSGGYTVIALAGGVYNPQMMGDYCTSELRGRECDLAEPTKVDFSGAGGNFRDPRIKSVFAMAPALGPGMTVEGLAAIEIPVGIITTEDDDLITPAHHAAHYAENIPGAELSTVPKGGHFVFVNSCTIVTTVIDIFIEEVDLCGREIDVDRATVQIEVATIVVEFLQDNLAPAS